MAVFACAIGCSTAPSTALSPLAPGPSPAGPGVAPSASPGTATRLSEPCTNGDGPGCFVLQVSCPGLPDARVELQVTPAVGASRGTILFGSGGSGTGFHGGTALLSQLAAAGFTVANRAWRGGWYGDGPQGFPASACRYATLVGWVRANVATAGPLCASGNSGGAAEIGYGLGFYANVRETLTLAVVTGGPVAARWDYACRGADDAAWQSECRASVPSGFCGGNYSCQLGAARGCPSAVSAADLLNDSVLAPAAVRDYPRTFTHFLQGLDDCGQPNVPIGLQWHREVTSAKALEFLPNTPHAVFSSREGQDALFAAFVARCR